MLIPWIGNSRFRVIDSQGPFKSRRANNVGIISVRRHCDVNYRFVILAILLHE